MIKFRLYFDKDAETEWLNKMANDGFAMKHFFAGFYTFEKCEPGEYTYQVDFGDRMFAVSDEYREFMQDTGVEIVQTWGYWIILRKLASEGTFELYTDVDSSIEHYQKIRRLFKVVAIIELLGVIFELVGAYYGFSAGCIFALILGAMALGFMNAVFKVNNTIAELQERKNGGVADKKNTGVSPLLAAGLLFNAGALLLEEIVPHPLKLLLQIAAIILMLSGVFFTVKKGIEKNI